MTDTRIFYKEDVKNIESVTFSLFTNKLVKSNSCIPTKKGINIAESYENYEPKKNGLVDLALGTSDIYLICTTCGGGSMECPGHFGHIELILPVFHFGFLNHLKNILQCVCIKCSKILVKLTDDKCKDILNKKCELRYKEIKFLTKTLSNCSYCNNPVPKIKREIKESGTIKILLEYSGIDNDVYIDSAKKQKNSLSPSECYDVLSNLSDQSCELLGFNTLLQRPEDMIIKIFPIPPVCIRPTAKLDFISPATMEDSLTLNISDIVISNNRLEKQYIRDLETGENSSYFQDLFNLLQLNVVTYFDNGTLKLPRTEFKMGNKITKSISERLKGKHGRMRSNLMGKRVDFSARTVITTDPYISIDQIGIPIKIAMELTIPEEVTTYNINKLNKLVNNGKTKYPGANFILKKIYENGNTKTMVIDLKYRRKEIKLNIGDIVERHMVDDDYILFNRQPTLHKPSMMGHRAHIIHNENMHTFRVNVSVCEPYNADFDGDEMNLHLGQTIQSRNEIELLANVMYQIIGAKTSNPIIGCQQDSISGAYMLSVSTKKIKGKDVANMLCNTSSIKKYNIDLDKEYTGNEIFSFIIPKEINIKKYDDNKLLIVDIVNGNIKTGILNKSLVSLSKNSITHYIWNKCGGEKTKLFINDAQKLILNYLLFVGQSISIRDIMIPADLKNKVKTILNTELTDVKIMLTESEKINSNVSNIEKIITEKLNIIQVKIGKIIFNSIDPSYFINVSIKSEAKGNITNVAQMSGTVGQQLFSGERIKKLNGRSFIYFSKYDDTPEARGFIINSYIQGLRGYEFFINASAGRDGLIDTALKTAQTGYIQRQLIKALEDLNIKYDNTNRNAKNNIVQFIYGENGINQVIQTDISIKIINMNNSKLKNIFTFTDSEINQLHNKLKINTSELLRFNEKYYNTMIQFRDEIRIIQHKVLLDYKIIKSSFNLPINFYRIIHDYNTNSVCIELSPSYIIESIESFIIDHDTRILTSIKKSHTYMKSVDLQLKYLLKICMYEYLSPKKCIFEYGLTKKKFDELMNEIKDNFIKSMVEPGEMVGILAGQSVGEPTSQITLNTKHAAGGGSVTSVLNMGVERIQELLHYTKNIKTPQMVIYFDKKHNKDSIFINKVVSNIKILTFNNLISNIEIYTYLPGKNIVNDIINNDNVKFPFFTNNKKEELENFKFLFRFKLDLNKLIKLNITMLDIKIKFISYWYKIYNNLKSVKKSVKDIITKIINCVILSNSEIDTVCYIHIRFNLIEFNYNIILEFLKIVTKEINLTGINSINDISYFPENTKSFNVDTGDVDTNSEFVAYTQGINMKDIKYFKGIDLTKLICNNIESIYKCYGIEATRQVLLYELTRTFELSGAYINNAHLSVVVDNMCQMGDIISIDRHGMNKLDLDPICRASFEKTVEHFINAAIFNEKDTFESVSSRIALGKVIKGGTGAFDLMLDIDRLKNSEKNNDDNIYSGFILLEEESLLKDMINNNLPNYNFFIPK